MDHLANEWKTTFAKKLQSSASQEMQDLLEYIAGMEKKLGRKVKDLASLQYVFGRRRIPTIPLGNVSAPLLITTAIFTSSA